MLSSSCFFPSIQHTGGDASIQSGGWQKLLLTSLRWPHPASWCVTCVSQLAWCARMVSAESIDENKDGTISKDELVKYMGSADFHTSAFMRVVNYVHISFHWESCGDLCGIHGRVCVCLDFGFVTWSCLVFFLLAIMRAPALHFEELCTFGCQD